VRSWCGERDGTRRKLCMRGIAGHGKPGPKMARPVGPKHAIGPGLGRNLRPDRSNGPGLGRGKRKISEGPARWPDSLTLFWPNGPGLGRKMRPDSRAGPGLGSRFWSRAFCWPGPTTCPGIMRGSKRRKVTFPYYTYMAPVASTLDHTINSFASLDACMRADIA
jgi:hypothetical protein